MSATWSKSARWDLPWETIGDRRAAASTSTAAQAEPVGAELQRGTAQEQPEPVVAELQHGTAQENASADATAPQDVEMANAEEASTSQESSNEGLESKMAQAKAYHATQQKWLAERKKTVDTAMAWNIRPGGPMGGEPSPWTSDELVMSGALPNPDPEEVKALATWKAAKKPKCSIMLSTGGICYGMHPEALHNEKQAVEAAKRRDALALLKAAAPNSVRSEADLAEQKRRAFLEEKAQAALVYDKDQGKPDAASKEGSKGDSSKSTKRKANAEPEADALDADKRRKASKDGLPPGTTCATCRKRHPGECRACKTCMKHPCRCPQQGAPAGVTAPRPQSAAWSYQDVLANLAHRIEGEVGMTNLAHLANRGQPPARNPGPQLPFRPRNPKGNGDAAKPSKPQGR